MIIISYMSGALNITMRVLIILCCLKYLKQH